jgi:hypothetical protein
MSLSEFVVYLSTLVRSVGLYSVFCVVSGVCGCCIRVFERFCSGRLRSFGFLRSKIFSFVSGNEGCL